MRVRTLLAFALFISFLSLPLAAAASEGGEALLLAARAGDLAKVRELVDGGVPVDSADKYGSTALSMAARAGHLAVVEYLLERGADVNRAESFYGTRALEMAVAGDHLKVAELLLRRGAEGREDVLEFAVARENWELARAAVEAGPLHASRLEALKASGTAEKPLAPELTALLEKATTRPDPPPPVLSAEQLEPFLGRYEGFDSQAEAEAEVVRSTTEGAALELRLPGEPPRKLIATGEQTFETADKAMKLYFYGRAGTIEGIRLVRGEGSAETSETLRRSIAQTVAPTQRAAGKGGSETATQTGTETARTVHWPGFRGPAASGIGDGDPLPADWDLASGQSVLWKAEIAGLGNSSPVVWGDTVFVTTAVAKDLPQEIRTGLTGDGSEVEEQVEHSWQVLAFDKWSGKPLWKTEVGRGTPLTRRHFKATQANSTPVTDGKRLVAVFPTAGLACLDAADGKILWHHDLGGLNAGAFNDPGIQWGFASSPILHEGRVILQVDVHEGGYLAAWDLATGKLAWKTPRDVAPSWATPALLRGPDGDELVVNGSTIHGYDAATGRPLWSLGPNSELVIATPLTDDGVAYVSAGYPPIKPIYAVRAGIRGDLELDPGKPHERLLWSHDVGGAYMPTPLLYRGFFYVVHHNARLVVYESDTGRAIHKGRFSRGGTFTGSPVAANGKLYLPTEDGLLYVLEAGRLGEESDFEELAVKDFGEPLMATPAISEGLLLLRTPRHLVALGAKPAP